MSKILEVRVPCSAGEFLQGEYKGVEALVSCPIDIYSTITIVKGISKNKLLSKSLKAIKNFKEKYKISNTKMDNINLTIDSPLPYGKGYATSTSEIAGIFIALSTYFKKDFSIEDIAIFCANIEPTDSIFLNDYMIFDHLNGNILKKRKVTLAGKKVIIIESNETIDTINFRKTNQFSIKPDLTNEFDEFFKGINTNDFKLVFNSLKSSSINNQKVIFKEKLPKTLEIALKYNSIGVNIAHSGSLIVIIYDEDFNQIAFIDEMKKENCIFKNDIVRYAMISEGGYSINDYRK
ncbi:GHMP family kinase ATP-binding protein [Helicovermis profundi]|uniref:Serine/threonine protein kinase n=1 Tax=Helicovermis profundi TaxID=3065157 RepID=A0AAU9EBL2_9FIRM|nr:serine/threonine protein kinase [Clostridia bacterium S502]